ncbi:MAG: six-cysteine ranthipeptide SCIFF [Firmicutes bacterium]|nr:six-cysteine ranthipeptide SCIFF [Bacillota bacterium]
MNSNFKIIASPFMQKDIKVSNCGECASSCQSACKTSCTVANQSCENETRVNTLEQQREAQE